MIGVSELLLIFLIVLVLFGTKKLRHIGGDLGEAIRNFRNAMNEPEQVKSEPGKVQGAGEATEDSEQKPR